MNSSTVTIFFVLLALSVFGFTNFVSSVYLNNHGRKVVDHIKSFGYPVEVYNVVSEDGYFLTTLRIPRGRLEDANSTQNATQKPIVFLMHGLGGSCFHYVATGPNHSIALILADSGHDVWLPNTRGSSISRKHVNLNPDRNVKYWDFSWHEIGYYDIPANIDLIRNVTGKNEMAYVGISQGTTVFFVMGADRPEYNKFFKVSIMLGPSAYVGHSGSFLINLIRSTGLIEPIKAIVNALGIHEVLPSELYPIINIFLNIFCGEDSTYQKVCLRIMTIVFDIDYNINLINGTIMPMFLPYSGTGASINQFYHYFQIVSSGKFEHYDLGRAENMRRYNSETPPPYNLRNVNAPVILFIGNLDVFAMKTDMDQLTSELPNSTVINVGHDYSHLDYLLAENAPELIHKRVIKLVAQYLGT